MNLPAARTMPFFPSEEGGKYHAAHLITNVAACGAPRILATTGAIYVEQGSTSRHPIICKRCATLALSAGYSAQGYRR